MKSLGGSPPWGVLHAMIDSADSDRNGKVKIFFEYNLLTNSSYYIDIDIIESKSIAYEKKSVE